VALEAEAKASILEAAAAAAMSGAWDCCKEAKLMTLRAANRESVPRRELQQPDGKRRSEGELNEAGVTLVLAGETGVVDTSSL